MSKKQLKQDYTYAVGRRREAVARVRLYSHMKDGQKWGEISLKKGQIIVNEKPVEAYFPDKTARVAYQKPLLLTKTEDKFAITVKVSGGGQNGQLEAMIAGIARTLASTDRVKFRPLLKSAGLLTRDPRVRQRRNVGTGGKARRKKQNPKR
ncbi:MAG TPA: 30S ribosomal protein S9 [Patescibacteria group bacterium]|nr:30S ribosomal protein S9 [Patescibacteria group bacterium]